MSGKSLPENNYRPPGRQERQDEIAIQLPWRAGVLRRLIPAALALAVAALTLYAYRELPARPFAADDFQWLLNVHGLSFGEVARKAFDPGAQSHFFRPLVWLLFWAQTRVFGLDPRGFHAVSLGLHLLNAGLLGWLAYRLQIADRRLQIGKWQSTSYKLRSTIPILVVAIVALHPAPFEAVVWISAQSELLAAALLLIALHLWLEPRTENRGPSPVTRHPSPVTPSPPHLVRGLLATLALALALLAKESAVIGLPLLMLVERSNVQTFKRSNVQRFTPYVLPMLITLAYIALQASIERRNYLLAQGGYGLGPQLVLNPLRSLALIVAPLSGTEHADAAWLVPVGIAVAIVLIVFTIYNLRFTISNRPGKSSIVDRRSSVRLILALALTLLPTAPFASPPDSRYLYLPVMAAALLAGFWILDSPLRGTRFWIKIRQSKMVWFVVVTGFLALVLAWWASGELHAREWRFAAASGPGGSLWRVASAVCAESRPDRMVIVEPPLAPPHAEAIVGLACGGDTRARIVGRDQIDGAIKGQTVVIAFPNGSAQVERRT
jgi:hypothetical protein